jgi:two-component system sensor histidine kinase KdpD
MLLVVEVDPSASSTVITDPDRVAQIVDPLVDNAVCHGGGRLQVHFDVDPAVDADQPVMRIRVADEGPGISPELHDEVFDPFVRGSPSVSGFGVGLALARAVAQALGGRLELVASDSGAVFEAQVPIEIGSHQAAANSAGPGMGAGTPRR